MTTGVAGTNARDVRMPVVQVISYNLNFNTTGAASGVRIGIVPQNAIILRWTARVLTAFNAGTTNPITIGTTGTGTQIAASASITSGTPGNYTGSPAAAAGWALMAADQSIFVAYIPTGTTATTGSAWIEIEYIQTEVS